ncbi:hypothetical protein J2W30_004489 [Variovorax boronicumulans]|nr:DUF4272 domain-containing protein [Variovorax boronicumulans]MDQ0036714.1 hypothetical protein [Variovorax boronicumulans]
MRSPGEGQPRHGATCADLDARVVVERRYALNWMIGYGESWDEVPLDT